MRRRNFGRHAGCGVRGVVAVLAATVTLGITDAHAVTLGVVNGGFEDNSVGNAFNEFTFGAPAGWDLYEETPGLINGGTVAPFFIGTLTPTTVTGHTGIQFFPDGAPEGSRVGIAFKYSYGTTGEFGLMQTLDDVLEANTRYDLSVLIGNIATGFSVSGDEFPLDGFPGYRVDLMAGTTVLLSDNNSLAGSIDDGEWGLSTVTFTTGATHDDLGENLAIRLVNLNVDDPLHSGQDLEVDFDDVVLTATLVPEPTGAAMLAAVVAIAGVRRTRRRSA